jgi:hypothetical protein
MILLRLDSFQLLAVMGMGQIWVSCKFIH